MKYDTDLLREANPLKDKVREYGVELNSRGYAPCPFHNEKTGSFKVYPDGTFHCFGCGAHGDVIDFVAKMDSIDFNEACKRLGGEMSFSGYRAANRRKRAAADKNRKIAEAWNEYYSALEAYESNEANIERLKPTSLDDIPSDVWTSALCRKAELQYALDVAETKIQQLERRDTV